MRKPRSRTGQIATTEWKKLAAGLRRLISFALKACGVVKRTAWMPSGGPSAAAKASGGARMTRARTGRPSSFSRLAE